MALADSRTYTDITICNVNGDILAKLKSFSEEDNADAIVLRAGKEKRPWVKAGYLTKTLRGELVVQTSPEFKASIGAHVLYTHDMLGTQESGTALLTRTGGTWETGGQEAETFELQVCGTPSLSS